MKEASDWNTWNNISSEISTVLETWSVIILFGNLCRKGIFRLMNWFTHSCCKCMHKLTRNSFGFYYNNYAVVAVVCSCWRCSLHHCQGYKTIPSYVCLVNPSKWILNSLSRRRVYLIRFEWICALNRECLIKCYFCTLDSNPG